MRKALGWAAIVALTAALPAPAASAVQVAPDGMLVPAGTAVRLALVAEIGSHTHGQGDRVPLTVADDVTVAGRLAIPRGTPALAEIARHRAKGTFGKSGQIELRLLHVDLDGRLIRLDGRRDYAGKSKESPALVSSILVGGIVGSIIKGKHAVLAAGTPLTGYVHRDVRIAAAP